MKKQKQNTRHLLSNQTVHNPKRIQKGPFINIIRRRALKLGDHVTTTVKGKKNFDFNAGGRGFDPRGLDQYSEGSTITEQ